MLFKRFSVTIVFHATGLDKQKIQRKIVNISYPSIFTFVLGAQKNRHIERVLSSTHNISFV